MIFDFLSGKNELISILCKRIFTIFYKFVILTESNFGVYGTGYIQKV